MIEVTKIFFRNKLGVDSAIFWSTVNKAFGIIKAPLSIYFIVKCLTLEDQGLWYTFSSLGALTVFAELGFVNIITQFVSHEYARLSVIDGKIKGDSIFMDRLIGLIRFSIKFYLIVIPLAILILSVVGYFYFRNQPTVYYAWFCFSIVGGISLFVGLLQAIYQGLDKVKEMQINALICMVIGTIFNWTMLLLHFKIWALVIGNLLGALVTCILLYYTAPDFWRQVILYKTKTKINFLKETLSLQGKYAVSWISGYFIFYLYVPATYKLIGPSQAGQLGMTMAVISVITGISGNWLSTKIPKFNILVSNKNKRELDQLFKKSFIQGFLVQIFLSVGFIIGMVILRYLLPDIAKRFLDIPLVVLVILVQLAYQIISSLAIYLRAHKQEPFVWISVMNALLLVIAVFVVLKHFNLNLFFWIVNGLYWVILLPMAYKIFTSKKIEFINQYYNSK